MRTLAPAEASVQTLRISAAAPLAPGAAHVLSTREAQRAAAFRQERDRRRYVVAHAWLRGLLGYHLGVHPADVPIAAGPCARCGGPHGKPQLPVATGVHFSLAHAGDFALCAIAETPVGVDIEVVRRGSAIPSSALHPRERRAIAAAAPAQRPLAFARCWVRKEAYLKGTGEGLNREPEGVWVGLGPRLDDPGPAPEELGGWRIADVDAPPGYAAAVAALAEPR